MEHVTITPEPDSYYRLTPDEGYMLLNKMSQRRYSEAVVHEGQIDDYEAVEAAA